MHATAVKPPATAAADARRHGFLVLLPRLAQVHVHVDESGAHDEAGRQVHDLRAVGAQVRADLGDAIAVDQHVEHAVASIGRVDDPPAFK